MSVLSTREFMGWRPKGQSEELNPKSFTLCNVYFPASGYMHLTEQGRLETRKEGPRRLYGSFRGPGDSEGGRRGGAAV